MRQIVLAQRDLDLHARIRVIAQHLAHPRHRLGVFRGLHHQVNHHHLTRLGPAVVTRLDQDVLADALVLRDHEIDAMFDKQAPHHLGVAALDHFDNAGLAASAPIQTDFTHHRAIAVQHAMHLLRSQEQVVGAIVRHQKAETVRVPLHLAGNEIELADQADIALAIAHHLAIALHGIEAANKAILLGIDDFQFIGQRSHIQRNTGLGQHIEDQLTAGNGVFVFLRFASPMRVTRAGGNGLGGRFCF